MAGLNKGSEWGWSRIKAAVEGAVWDSGREGEAIPLGSRNYISVAWTPQTYFEPKPTRSNINNNALFTLSQRWCPGMKSGRGGNVILTQ